MRRQTRYANAHTSAGPNARPNERCAAVWALISLISILAASGAWAKTPKSPKGLKPPAAVVGPALSLSEYLNQVGGKHLGIKAADQTARAARQYSAEGSLIYKPLLVGNGVDTADSRNNPLFGDSYARTQTYSLGVSEATPIGLMGKLSYNYAEFDVPGVINYNTGYVQVDLSQSLLRNFNGSESRQQEELATTGALAKAFAQSYATKSLMLEAESNYWRLALAREMVLMQQDAVDRAQRIWDWTSRRVRFELSDRSETLQASTNLQARKVDLLAAQNEERAAAQAFNSSRGSFEDTVTEHLVDLSPDLLVSLNPPDRMIERDDVKSAGFQAKANSASALLAKERNRATLEVYGSTVVSNPNSPPAQISAFLPPSSKPSTVIGLRLIAPLDLSTVNKVQEGYAAEAQAANWTYDRKVFEEERDWRDLNSKFVESKNRLLAYLELEKTQREKLDYERDRQTRGRSTLQQVLLFETDYQLAQLGRIRTLADLLTLNAQMKLFGASYESR